jgi:DNA-binding beta-propeller fold protein YncE
VTGSTDATGAAARFNFPSGVATDSAGNVYVADSSNSTIRKITPAGAVSTLAGTAGVRGSTDGTGAAARFNFPNGVATDSAGNVYVADRSNNAVRKITPAGAVSTVVGVAGQVSFAPGALPGLLGCPNGVAVSGTSLYITLYDGVAVVQNRP